MSNESDNLKIPRINSVKEFFAQALAIEEEASERYNLLADQMEVHNKAEIAAIFRKMANIEALHREEVARRAGDRLVGGEQAAFSWLGPQGPEATDFEDVHYLMTPHQALQLARFNELRAVAFFESIASTAVDAEVKALAEEMARDERDHVLWVDDWLKKFPEDTEVLDDPDPPVYSE
ncbi:MAG: rubrerythrin [Xanthobacteraceae bacterium]|nr:MAG: rubrerythrin [Xanthobacteraceae bacterium]